MTKRTTLTELREHGRQRQLTPSGRDYDALADTVLFEGFFSEYLPPCFKLDTKVKNRTPQQNCDLIEPFSFTMSRYDGNNGRRKIFIPEIGSYLVAMQFIRDNNILKELIEFSENSENSFSPILAEDDTFITHEAQYDEDQYLELKSPFIENITKKIIKSAGAKFILKLDIANCFLSFYVHMLPAILLGFESANNEYLNSDNASYTLDPTYEKYVNFDRVIRKMNHERTNGLLPGPILSKIIMESFLTRIDLELKAQGINFSRYVDDYEVYLYEDNESQVINIFADVLNKYFLSLNYQKSEKIGFPFYISKNLGKIFMSHTGKELYDAEIMELFNDFLSIEESGVKGSIRFLLKSLEQVDIKMSNGKLCKSYLITLIKNNERSLAKACSLLINKKETFPLDLSDVDFLKKLLELHLNANNDLEAIWILYLLIMTDNIITEEPILDKIISFDNELLHTLLLEKNILSSEKIECVAQKAMSWLLLYQLFARDIISEEDFKLRGALKKNFNMYQYLKNHNISFVKF